VETSNKRHWYKMRWQVWVILFVAIVAIVALRYQSTRPLEALVTSPPTGQTVSLKKRMIFLVTLERKFHRKGWLASLGLEGENGSVLKIYWESINLPFIKLMLKSTDFIQDIREMGFKRLVINNGKQKWDIDLKN